MAWPGGGAPSDGHGGFGFAVLSGFGVLSGLSVGLAVGFGVAGGSAVGDGLAVGFAVGDGLAVGVGFDDGLAVGEGFGVFVGRAVGSGDETAVGAGDGATVGGGVGWIRRRGAGRWRTGGGWRTPWAEHPWAEPVTACHLVRRSVRLARPGSGWCPACGRPAMAVGDADEMDGDPPGATDGTRTGGVRPGDGAGDGAGDASDGDGDGPAGGRVGTTAITGLGLGTAASRCWMPDPANPSATVARTRLTTPRARTSRTRWLDVTRWCPPGMCHVPGRRAASRPSADGTRVRSSAVSGPVSTVSTGS